MAGKLWKRPRIPRDAKRYEILNGEHAGLMGYQISARMNNGTPELLIWVDKPTDYTDGHMGTYTDEEVRLVNE